MRNILYILKYLSGTLSKKDREAFGLWLDIATDNRRQYSLIKKIFESGEKIKNIRLFDEEKAWSDFLRRLRKEKSKVVNITRKRFVRVISVAASLIFLYFSFNFFFSKEKELNYTNFVCVSDLDTLQLVDGSKVFMKKGAVLKYFTGLKKTDSIRFVELDGTATFDVAANKKLPFIIKAGEAGVRVLGTSFELKNKGDRVELENFKGLIRLYEWNDKTNNLLVKKGEKAVFDGSNIKPARKKETDKQIMSGQYHMVEDVIDYMMNRFETRISTAPYADIMMEDKVFVDLNQSLENILTQLDTTSILKFRKTCRNCYEIMVLKSYY